MSKGLAHKVCNAKTKTKWKQRMPGRPKIFAEKSERILRTFFKLRRRSQTISVKDLIVESGLHAKKYCRRAVSRFLNINGYKFLLARQKGLPGDDEQLTIHTEYARLRKSFGGNILIILQVNLDFILTECLLSSSRIP